MPRFVDAYNVPTGRRECPNDIRIIAWEANEAQHAVMLNLLSLVVGAVALVLGILAFFPLLGWAYWLIIPIALVGLGFGVVSRKKSGRNLNLVVIIMGVIRLMLGGGII